MEISIISEELRKHEKNFLEILHYINQKLSENYAKRNCLVFNFFRN